MPTEVSITAFRTALQSFPFFYLSCDSRLISGQRKVPGMLCLGSKRDSPVGFSEVLQIMKLVLFVCQC